MSSSIGNGHIKRGEEVRRVVICETKGDWECMQCEHDYTSGVDS